MLERFDITDEQRKEIEKLRVRIKMEEEKVEREMERQQVAMADLKIVELAKLSCRAMK
ncbi:TGACG-sequence-specific DNA-binding protein TGA-2.1, partial [Trifolium medium]|nr:TGACG-sequence-specific DNA-binding protein TGA-2.1 [Trifolium medium]